MPVLIVQGPVEMLHTPQDLSLALLLDAEGLGMRLLARAVRRPLAQAERLAMLASRLPRGPDIDVALVQASPILLVLRIQRVEGRFCC